MSSSLTERSGDGLIATRREQSANRAVVLGLLALPFGIFAPFAIWAGVSSLRSIRKSNGALIGESSAVFGLVAGVLGVTALIVGTSYWFIGS
jgi:hypothetical protein